jgi:hypothetical protein
MRRQEITPVLAGELRADPNEPSQARPACRQTAISSAFIASSVSIRELIDHPTT